MWNWDFVHFNLHLTKNTFIQIYSRYFSALKQFDIEDKKGGIFRSHSKKKKKKNDYLDLFQDDPKDSFAGTPRKTKHINKTYSKDHGKSPSKEKFGRYKEPESEKKRPPSILSGSNPNTQLPPFPDNRSNLNDPEDAFEYSFGDLKDRKVTFANKLSKTWKKGKEALTKSTISLFRSSTKLIEK